MTKTILKNCRIMDVEKEEVYDGTIAVNDDTISEVIRFGEVPNEGKVIDLKGMTVMPGLFNCHTHMSSDCAADPKEDEDDCQLTMISINNLKKFVDTGCTMIRDVGCPDFVDIDIRNEAEKQTMTAPDMLVSGKCVVMTGGHGWKTAREADGPDECRKAAREQLRAGADWVKIMSTGGVMTRGCEPGSPQLGEDEIRAVCIEAHHAGRKVATHAQGMEGIKNALRGGVDSIEHGFYMDQWCFDYMKEHHVYYTPTLSAMYWLYVNGEKAGIPAFMMRKVNAAYEAHRTTFLNAYKAGVKIVLGTDAGTPFNGHEKTAYEMVLMHNAGMSVWDALKCGTVNAAEMLGVKDTLGTIEPGKRANLAVFKEDPSVDLENAMDCRMTMVGGRILHNTLK